MHEAQRRPPTPALLALLLLSSPAAAQPSAAPLHELVPDTPGRAAATGPPAAPASPAAEGTPAPAATGLPDGILHEGVGLLAPDDPPDPRPGERSYGTPGAGAPDRARPERATLDRSVEPEGRLRYSAVFNPSVAPFKRDAAYDELSADESLAVSLGPWRPAERGVAGPPRPGWERFWGSVSLELRAGRPSPLPSVAPDGRILGWRSDPPVPLELLRDPADNLWARSPDAYEGSLRLVFLTEVRESYFGGPIPEFQRRDLPPSLRRELPPALRPHARRVLAAVGIDERSPAPTALAALVSYFRSFEAGTAPPEGPESSLYLDLSLAQRGVCRHRAQAFVITATAAGLVARYVHNDAHAFTEVYLPAEGWRRVDLGGAAAGLDVENGLGKVPHRPRLADPLPRPAPYGRSYSGGDGVPDEAEGEGTARRNPGEPASGGAAGDPGAETAARSPWGAAEDDALRPEAAAAGPPRSIELEASEGLRGYRGEALRVAGRVRAAGGAPLAGAPVALVLRRRAGGPVLQVLGLLVSGGAGRFTGEVVLPPELKAGRYELDAVDGRPYLRDATGDEEGGQP